LALVFFTSRKLWGYCTSTGTVKISKILCGITKQAEAVNRSEKWGELYSAHVNASHTGTLLLGLKPDTGAVSLMVAVWGIFERGSIARGKEGGKCAG